MSPRKLLCPLLSFLLGIGVLMSLAPRLEAQTERGDSSSSIQSTTILLTSHWLGRERAGMLSSLTVGAGDVGDVARALSEDPDTRTRKILVLVPAWLSEQERGDYARAIQAEFGGGTSLALREDDAAPGPGQNQVQITPVDVEGIVEGIDQRSKGIMAAAAGTVNDEAARDIAVGLVQGNEKLKEEITSWSESFRTWRADLTKDPKKQTRLAGFAVAMGRSAIASYIVLWKMAQAAGGDWTQALNFGSGSSILLTGVLMTIYTAYPNEVAYAKKGHSIPIAKESFLVRAYDRTQFVKMTAFSFALGFLTQTAYRGLLQFEHPDKFVGWYSPQFLGQTALKEGAAAILTTCADSGLIDLLEDGKIGQWSYAVLNWFVGMTGQMRQVFNAAQMFEWEMGAYAIDAGAKILIKAWSKKLLRQNVGSILLHGRLSSAARAERSQVRDAILNKLAQGMLTPADFDSKMARLQFDEKVESTLLNFRRAVTRKIADIFAKIGAGCEAIFYREKNG